MENDFYRSKKNILLLKHHYLLFFICLGCVALWYYVVVYLMYSCFYFPCTESVYFQIWIIGFIGFFSHQFGET
jgi:hypothetical protein